MFLGRSGRDSRFWSSNRAHVHDLEVMYASATIQPEDAILSCNGRG